MLSLAVVTLGGLLIIDVAFEVLRVVLEDRAQQAGQKRRRS